MIGNLLGKTFNGDVISGKDNIQTVGCDSDGSPNSQNESMEEVYALEQNIPNPFNPETEIHFQIPIADHVIIKIYNTLGQEIKILADEEFQPGYHNLRWDGRDYAGNLVPSGVYFLNMRPEDLFRPEKCF